MTRTPPAWARPGPPEGAVLVVDPADSAIAEHAQALQRAAAIDRLSGGRIPLPLNRDAAVREIDAERQAARLPTRGKWKAIAELDAKVRAHLAALADVRAHAAQLREQLPDAERQDAQRLADWHERGRRGDRPQPRQAAIEEELAQLEQDARVIASLVDSALDAKAQHVAKTPRAADPRRVEGSAGGGSRLRRNGPRARAQTRAAARGAVDAPLGGAFPRSAGDQRPAEPFDVLRWTAPADAGGDRRRHTQRPIATVLAVLERDARTLATHGTQTGGGEKELDLRDKAVWKDTPEGQEAFQRETKRLREQVPKPSLRAEWVDD